MIKPLVNKKSVSRRHGLTLVELLIVVTIIMVMLAMVAAWGYSARKQWQRRATESTMAALLPIVDQLKNTSVIYPDHRLANYFYIQPHTAAVNAVPTWAGGANHRQMSSGEFLAFLASRTPGTETNINHLGASLKGSTLPSTWGVAQSDHGPLVDVFQVYPSHATALAKANALFLSQPLEYALMSPSEGYRLRAPVDAWGSPILYRLSTFGGDLNQSDLTPGDTPAANSGSVAPTIEYIVQDEQFALDSYNANGIPCYGPSALATSDAGKEIVRPAIAVYPHCQFISAGPDGVWGAFVDDQRDARGERTQVRGDHAQDNVYSQESNQ